MVSSYIAAFVAALLPAATAAASAPGGTGASTINCDVNARVYDPDPAGSNVRAGPGGAILKRIPSSQRVDGDVFVPELRIVGFDRGWAKVVSIRFRDYGNGETLLFAGPGWMSGRHLTGDLTSPLRSAPSASAPMVAGGPSPASLDDAEMLSIDDCTGRFSHVVVRVPGGRTVSGWTERPCANQATTCG